MHPPKFGLTMEDILDEVGPSLLRQPFGEMLDGSDHIRCSIS